MTAENNSQSSSVDGGIAAAVAAAEEAVKHHDESEEDSKIRKRKERLEQNRIRYVATSTIFTELNKRALCFWCRMDATMGLW